MPDSETILYDISRPLAAGVAVWPGDPPFELDWPVERHQPNAPVVARIRLGTHTATHVDAPFHFFSDGSTVDAVPLETFIGKAVLVDVTDRESIDAAVVRSVLEVDADPRRVLFRTAAWSGVEHGGFPERYAGLDHEAARALATAGVRLIGTDAPSVDPPDSPDHPAHGVLLREGICILENLDLDAAPPGTYELIAFPLRLTGADASPVRAVLRGR